MPIQHKDYSLWPIEVRSLYDTAMQGELSEEAEDRAIEATDHLWSLAMNSGGDNQFAAIQAVDAVMSHFDSEWEENQRKAAKKYLGDGTRLLSMLLDMQKQPLEPKTAKELEETIARLVSQMPKKGSA
jgi:hypothetical protein